MDKRNIISGKRRRNQPDRYGASVPATMVNVHCKDCGHPLTLKVEWENDILIKTCVRCSYSEVLRGLQHYSKFVDLVVDYGRNQLNPSDDEDETERPEFSDDEAATSSNVDWTMESRVIKWQTLTEITMEAEIMAMTAHIFQMGGAEMMIKEALRT